MTQQDMRRKLGSVLILFAIPTLIMGAFMLSQPGRSVAGGIILGLGIMEIAVGFRVINAR